MPDVATNIDLLKVLSKLIVIFFLIVVFAVVAAIADDYAKRYYSWRSLDSNILLEGAQNYSGGVQSCLYIVECSSGSPELELITNIGHLDVDELKKVIWERRFHDFCAGPTENIVLDFPDAVKSEKHISSARWSYYNDRFITNNGRFQGSYISSVPWEPCTADNATWNDAYRR